MVYMILISYATDHSNSVNIVSDHYLSLHVEYTVMNIAIYSMYSKGRYIIIIID